MFVIDNWNEHAVAISCVGNLMETDPDLETEEGQALDELAHAVEIFEKENLPCL